jgi:hypothetical protein
VLGQTDYWQERKEPEEFIAEEIERAQITAGEPRRVCVDPQAIVRVFREPVVRRGSYIMD